jgi:ATP-dependent protease ClpP protease subunit
MARRINHTSYLFDYGINPTTKTIYLNGYIKRSSAIRLHKALTLLDGTPEQWITIWLNSQGGDFYQALAMYDAIRSCTSRVRIIGTGEISSCAVLILQAGDERLLSSNSSVLVHKGWQKNGTLHFDAQDIAVAEGKRIMNRAWSIVAESMGIKLNQFLNRYRFKDEFYDADTAVTKKLADGIYGKA